MKVGSLFSGIGGFELGFEREGFETKWFVEKDLFCQAVLRKHWPKVKIYGDITSIDFRKTEPVDVLCGGFPCQDISVAGKGKGITGERSGLWKEYLRAIREIRPKYAVIENVPMLVNRGLNVVLTDLAEARYDAEWFSLSAREVGAPHKRERIFIVGYPNSNRLEKDPCNQPICKLNLYEEKWSGRYFQTNSEEMQMWKKESPPITSFCGVADGLSNRVDRVKSLGNAVVPQVAQFIARRIKETEKTKLKSKKEQG